MKKFTVKRSRWARGGNNGKSRLLNEDGNKCCLGFAICQISKHIPVERLLNMGCPNNVFSKESFLTYVDEDGIVNDNLLADYAMAINDDHLMLDKMREQELKKLFREHKIIIKFVD